MIDSFPEQRLPVLSVLLSQAGQGPLLPDMLQSQMDWIDRNHVRLLLLLFVLFLVLLLSSLLLLLLLFLLLPAPITAYNDDAGPGFSSPQPPSLARGIPPPFRRRTWLRCATAHVAAAVQSKRQDAAAQRRHVRLEANPRPLVVVRIPPCHPTQLFFEYSSLL